MNTKRGFYRLWLALSALWVAYWLWRKDLPCLLGFNIGHESFACQDPYAYPMEVYGELLAILFGPPLVFGVIIFLIFWTIAGFKTPK